MARPTDYTIDIARDICTKLAHGIPMTKICKQEGMPDISTVYRWLLKDKEFCDMYARAREDAADTLADEIIEISDDASNDTITQRHGNNEVEVENREWTNRSRLRVDARKWVAAKLKPRKYSDQLKIDAEIKGDIKITFNLDNDIPNKPAT